MSCYFIIFARWVEDADGILRNVFIFFPLRFSNVIFMQIKVFFLLLKPVEQMESICYVCHGSINISQVNNEFVFSMKFLKSIFFINFLELLDMCD